MYRLNSISFITTLICMIGVFLCLFVLDGVMYIYLIFLASILSFFLALFSFGDVKSGKAYFMSLFSASMNFIIVTVVGFVILVGLFLS